LLSEGASLLPDSSRDILHAAVGERGQAISALLFSG
jgi:hypothetical protein